MACLCFVSADDTSTEYYPIFFTTESPFQELYVICIQLVAKTWREMRAKGDDFTRVRRISRCLFIYTVLFHVYFLLYLILLTFKCNFLESWPFSTKLYVNVPSLVNFFFPTQVMSVVENQIKEALKEKQPTMDLFKVILFEYLYEGPSRTLKFPFPTISKHGEVR